MNNIRSMLGVEVVDLVSDGTDMDTEEDTDDDDDDYTDGDENTDEEARGAGCKKTKEMYQEEETDEEDTTNDEDDNNEEEWTWYEDKGECWLCGENPCVLVKLGPLLKRIFFDVDALLICNERKTKITRILCHYNFYRDFLPHCIERRILQQYGFPRFKLGYFYKNE